jgi:HEAT repeat protein
MHKDSSAPQQVAKRKFQFGLQKLIIIVAIFALLLAWLRSTGALGMILGCIIGTAVVALFLIATKKDSPYVLVTIFCGLVPAGVVAFFVELSVQSFIWASVGGVAAAVVGFSVIRFRGFRIAFLSLAVISAVCIPPLWPRMRAYYLLRCIGDPDTDFIARSKAMATLHGLGTSMVPFLVDAMKGENDLARDAAADVLSRIGPSSAPYFIQLLRDKRAATRAKSAAALGEIMPAVEMAVPHLISALEDDDSSVRYAAALSLGYMGSVAGDAAPALANSLRDEDPRVRARAATALGWIGPPASDFAIPDLIVAARDPDVSVRKAVFDAFGNHRIPPLGLGAGKGIGAAAIPCLIAFLEDDDPSIRELSAWAMCGFGPEAKSAVPRLMKQLKTLNPKGQGYVHMALQKIDPDGSIQRATRAAQDDPQ